MGSLLVDTIASDNTSYLKLSSTHVRRGMA